MSLAWHGRIQSPSKLHAGKSQILTAALDASGKGPITEILLFAVVDNVYRFVEVEWEQEPFEIVDSRTAFYNSALRECSATGKTILGQWAKFSNVALLQCLVQTSDELTNLRLCPKAWEFDAVKSALKPGIKSLGPAPDHGLDREVIDKVHFAFFEASLNLIRPMASTFMGLNTTQGLLGHSSAEIDEVVTSYHRRDLEWLSQHKDDAI